MSCSRGLDDDVAALRGEALEPVLLDLALRVEPELALDPDLDPEPLAVEAVLVALVEPAGGLVALEDVLQRPPPRRVDGELLVRGDRAVDERPLRAAAVARAQRLEGALGVPAIEHGELDRVRVGLLRQRVEHAFQSTEGNDPTHEGR